MIRGLLTLLTALSLVACARNRGPEKLRFDETKDWVNKSSLLGGEQADVYGYKVTIVKASSNGGFGFVGLQNDMKMGYFQANETTLQFKSLEGPYEGAESENVVNPTLVSWPATHHDVRLDQNEGRVTNREIDDDFKRWNQKKYMNVSLGEPNIDEAQTLPYSPALATTFGCWEVGSRERLRDSMQIEEGYFSFVTEVVYKQNPLCAQSLKQHHNADFTYTVHYRYSFRKLETSDYRPLEYTGGELDPLRQKYGYFQTVKPELDPSQPGGLVHRFLVNRWHPNKTHYFYFADGTPENFKPIFRDIFAQTNELMKNTGKAIRFEIHDHDYNHETGKNDGVPRQFGDLRYSFINIIDEMDPSAPLGYGPSDAHPLTGEMLAANTMIWTGSLQYYMTRLEVMAEELGENKFTENTLYQKMTEAMDTDPETWESRWDMDKSPLGKAYQQLVKDTAFNTGAYNSFTFHPGQQIDLPVWVDTPNRRDPLNPLETPGLSSDDYLQKVSDVLDVINNHERTFNKYFYEIAQQGQQVAKLRPFAMTRIFDDPRFASYVDFMKVKDGNLSEDAVNLNEALTKHMEHEHKLNMAAADGHCMYPVDMALAGGDQLFLEGLTKEQIIETIVYRVSIHEFGHNLALRHNFFGTVDNANFRLADNPETAKYLDPVRDEKSGEIVLGDDGKPLLHGQLSSSVMDYLRLEHEVHAPRTWEDYDRAALYFAYTEGQELSPDRTYLFCTDEHTLTHALCNRFDKGSTPSEILMSIIESYVSSYPIRNYRAGRAFWNTSGYAGAVGGIMRQVKEFYAQWRTGFAQDIVNNSLDKNLGIKDTNEQKAIFEEVDREMKKVMKLSMAFYQSVLQQSAAQRPFRSVYDEGTGALKRIGITFDKLYAMVFLAGDATFPYHPNRYMIHQSYLTRSKDEGLEQFNKEIWENVVTQRVDMEPWFISFGRALYAASASNFHNRDDSSFIDRIRLSRFDGAELLANLGIQFESDNPAETYVLSDSVHPNYKNGTTVVVVNINETYYVVDKTSSTYAYTVVQRVIDDIKNGNSNVQSKIDLEELWLLTKIATGSPL